MILLEMCRKMKFWNRADRIGPDIPLTHWRLHFKSTMLKMCKKKFRRFDDTAEFRAGAYAIGCSKISIGKRVIIRPGTMLYADPRENGAGITIEDGAMLGSGVHIYLVDHYFENPDIPIIDQGERGSGEVVLKKGCWVGANSVILPHVVIGENAVVAAGSVVTKSVPDRVIAAGNPARILEKL